jgi:hypothetical protein
MGKIVVNKHKQFKDNVTPSEFVNKGEIVISNQVGAEGIFIMNMNGETVFIPAKNNVESSTHVLLSSSEYEELVSSGRVVVNGNEIIYNDNVYYAIYEEDNE